MLSEEKNNTSLKRVISLPLLIFYGLGNILGAGIYVVIGKIAGISGIYMPLSFLIACVIVLFTAFSYAELSARYPVSAGEAVYLYEGFGIKELSIAIGIIIALSGVLSSATIIHGFYGYLSTFVDIPEFLVSISLIFLLTLIATWGIGKSVKVTVLFTFLEIFGLFLVIYVALPYLSFDLENFAKMIPPADFIILNNIILGAFLAFYAFIGFEDMVNIAQEVKDPTSTMPKAIIITLFIATILYFAISFVSISLLSPDILSSTSAPLAAVYEKATSQKAVVLSFIGMFAVINGVLVQIIMVSRIFYGMSAKGWMPKFLGIVNPKTSTPVYATIITSLIILVLSLLLPLITLAQSTSFVIFIVFTLVNMALIKIKLKAPHPKGITIFPIRIPIIAIILNLFMLGVQILSF
ncbi:amino acid permease [Sulfurimonas sp. NWX79]|uniref:APC family permease n=1 Tax=Sulfurimonas sp. NWX79 TaxID=2925412 RepID=UPI003204B425